jgi:hypothetical protein
VASRSASVRPCLPPNSFSSAFSLARAPRLALGAGTTTSGTSDSDSASTSAAGFEFDLVEGRDRDRRPCRRHRRPSGATLPWPRHARASWPRHRPWRPRAGIGAGLRPPLGSSSSPLPARAALDGRNGSASGATDSGLDRGRPPSRRRPWLRARPAGLGDALTEALTLALLSAALPAGCSCRPRAARPSGTVLAPALAGARAAGWAAGLGGRPLGRGRLGTGRTLADEWGLADFADNGIANGGLADHGLANRGLANRGLAIRGLAIRGLTIRGLANRGLTDESADGFCDRHSRPGRHGFCAGFAQQPSWRRPI